MTVYAKIENNELITAYNGYNEIIGLADSPELCEANGFTAYDETEYALFQAGQRELMPDGTLRDLTTDASYITDKKVEQIETLTGQYATDKSERMISWISTFINGISTATSLDDIKAKANAFKTKLATLQTDYANKCTEVENG